MVSFRALAVDHCGEHIGNRFHPAPVLAQCVQQLGTERHVAVALAFALSNVDQHELLIDVGGFQLHQFAAAHAGGVQGRQDGAIQQVESISRVTSSRLSTVGRRSGTLGKGGAPAYLRA